MAEWNGNPSWTSAEEINGGRQFSANDTLTPEDFNALVQNMQYLYSNGGDFEVNPYPIGSIYMSTNSTSPAYLFGGSWTQLKSKYLLAANNDYSLGQPPTYNGLTEGGRDKVNLTRAQLPPHVHNQYIAPSDGGWSAPQIAYGLSTNSGVYEKGSTAKRSDVPNTQNVYTSSVGDGEPIDIMPPYLAVYVWKRIS